MEIMLLSWFPLSFFLFLYVQKSDPQNKAYEKNKTTKNYQMLFRSDLVSKQLFATFVQGVFFYLQVAEVYLQFTMSARFTTRGRTDGHPVHPWERGGQGRA